MASIIIWAIVHVISLALFFYIELYVPSVILWMENTWEICPPGKRKITAMLHYHNINGMAYFVSIPLFYLLKVLNYKWGKHLDPYQNHQFRFSLKRISFSVIVYLLNLAIWAEIVPLILFGTTKLGYV